ncbi:MAG: DUF4062 domain-containing protein [Candidatus Competibacter sp.]
MPDLYENYRIFISSPGDVAAERQFAEEVINRINRSCSEVLKISVSSQKWEHLPPESPHLPEEKLQDLINKEVEKSHFFVLILFKRYGRKEPGHLKSNTERELETILKRYETNPQIRILAYFRDIPHNPDPGDQETAVLELRNNLEKLGIRYRNYKLPEEFKEEFTHDMYNVVLRMRLSPFKKQALHRFFKMGESNRPTYPRIAILFPSVSRQFMYPQKDKIWLKRLEPNIYFEDYKALHKIKKLLSFSGFHSYKTFLYTDQPSELDFMNRVWMCFPRSRTAIKYLDKVGETRRFHFDFRKEIASTLYWKQPDGSNYAINSPLSLYLAEQRKKMQVTGEHSGDLRRILAKDYAVIARFPDIESANITDEGYLYDYFFAGIRGLGTWGAAWFLDRKSKTLISYPDQDSLQILLEVTYQDGNVTDVKDVSNKTEQYFQEQSNVEYIRKQITQYKEREP